MSSSGPAMSHGHSTSGSNNLSQASTKLPGSELSTSFLSTEDANTNKNNHLNVQDDSTDEASSTRKDFLKDAYVEKYDVDNLSYNKPGTAWTESTNVPREHLGFIQVAAFMINQTIGTGIFSSPGYILLLTRSKTVSIGLWIAGGVYQLLTACIFLEFSTALPYNGGALIYLDEAFPKPRMLAATLFSFFWIALASNDGNCVTAGVYILELVHPTLTYDQIDNRSAQFMGIIMNSLVCLLLYFMLRGCLLLNTISATFKVIMLTAFFVAGITHACRNQSSSGLKDFNVTKPGGNAIDSIAAMTYVIGTYEGWENTNYIAGEIKASARTLKLAAFTTISLMMVLYVLVTTAYLAVLSYDQIANTQDDISVLFAQTVFGGGTATKAAITVSAITNLIVSTYTAAKVKQAIAWQRIIPFSKFFGKQDTQFNSPGGALVLHWIFTTIQIAVVRVGGDPWNFETGLFVYGYEIMLFFLGVGIFFLPLRMKIINPEWKPMYLKSTLTRLTACAVFAGMSVLLLYSFAEPSTPLDPPLYYWAIVLVGLLGIAAIYWGALRSLQMHWGSEDTLGKRLGFEVSVHEIGDGEYSGELAEMMKAALADGSRRRLTYKVSGNLAKASEEFRRIWARLLNWLG